MLLGALALGLMSFTPESEIILNEDCHEQAQQYTFLEGQQLGFSSLQEMMQAYAEYYSNCVMLNR